MDVRVRLPSSLRLYAAGQVWLTVGLPNSGDGTVGRLLTSIGDDYPGVRQRILDDLGGLRPHVNVFVNGESIRHLAGLATALRADDEIWVLPAVSGGATVLR